MAPDQNWKLRPYRDGDEQGILDCLTSAFGTWPAVDIDVPPIDHLRWKLNSPGVEGLHYIVEADGRVVGTRLLVSQQWLVMGRLMDCTKSTDLCFDRAFRGRGIFRPLWDEHEGDCRGRYGLSIGFTDVQKLREYMFIQGHRRPANQLDHLECAVGDGQPRRDKTFSIRWEKTFRGDVADLVAAASEQFDLMNARTVPFLNWRYADPRAGLFSLCVARQNGTVVGYAAFTVSRGRAFVADLLVRPGCTDALRALIGEAIGYARGKGVGSVRAWCLREHPYRAVLLDCGFVATRGEASVSIMSYGPDLSFVSSDPVARLHIVPGDTDVV